MTHLESKFKKDLREEIESIFPGCVIMKNDAGFIQGIPDMIILWENKWAMLEVKRSATEIHQPNQDYYVDMLDDMFFSAFIYPENKGEVLNALELAFRPTRTSRVSRTK